MSIHVKLLRLVLSSISTARMIAWDIDRPLHGIQIASMVTYGGCRILGTHYCGLIALGRYDGGLEIISTPWSKKHFAGERGKHWETSTRISARRSGAYSWHRRRLGERQLTGLLSMLFRSFRPFLIWLFNCAESRGFNNSKLHSSSPETDMIAPQLSNSPQYYDSG
jgi:hypothetical protein